MPQTPNYNLPYPLATDPADVPADMQELANAVDTSLDTVDDRVDVLEPKVSTLQSDVVSLDSRLDTIEPTIPLTRIPPGTTGQVLTTAAGPVVQWAAGGGGGGAMQMIEDKLLGADGAIDFTAIPGTFKHLAVIAALRGTTTDPLLSVQFNGDGGGNYDRVVIQVVVSTLSGSSANGQTSVVLGECVGSNQVAGLRAGLRLDVLDYAAARWKPVSATEGYVGAANGGRQYQTQGAWRQTAVITRLTLNLSAGTFAAGSRATLYGIN